MSQNSSSINYSNYSDLELAKAIQAHETRCLASVLLRTNTTTNAIVRRAVASTEICETILSRVYSRLWYEAPRDVNFQGWLRKIAWQESVATLRERNLAPRFPSVSLMLPDLPKPTESVFDLAEKQIGLFPERWQRAIVQSHDMGIPTHLQEDPDAALSLINALLNLNVIRTMSPEDLAGYELVDYASPALVERVPKLADWAVMIGTYAELEAVNEAIKEDSELEEISKNLQRGVRRISNTAMTTETTTKIALAVITEYLENVGPAQAVAPQPSHDPEPTNIFAPIAQPPASPSPSADSSASDPLSEPPTEMIAPGPITSIPAFLNGPEDSDPSSLLPKTTAQPFDLLAPPPGPANNPVEPPAVNNEGASLFGSEGAKASLDPFDDDWDEAALGVNFEDDMLTGGLQPLETPWASTDENDDDPVTGTIFLHPPKTPPTFEPIQPDPQAQANTTVKLGEVLVKEASSDASQPFANVPGAMSSKLSAMSSGNIPSPPKSALDDYILESEKASKDDMYNINDNSFTSVNGQRHAPLAPDQFSEDNKSILREGETSMSQKFDSNADPVQKVRDFFKAVWATYKRVYRDHQKQTIWATGAVIGFILFFPLNYLIGLF